MSKLLGKYTNGNYRVAIYDDGTKVRYNDDNYMEAEFPESIDVKVTNFCTGTNCRMCHEQSGPHGVHGDLNNPLLDTLHPYTELAIGGGNPLEHPDLIEFLQKMKDKKVICNLTVNLEHFLKHYNELLSWSERKLIHGIGVSVGRPVNEKERDLIAEFPNSVVHVIAGIVHNEVLDSLADADIRLLILGYKKVGRGIKYYEDNAVRIDQLIKILSDRLSYWRHRFKLISFDNLALTQLDVKSLVSPEEWEQSYMGDDGQYTMYIDLCKNEYAVASTMERHPIPENIKTIDELFAIVKDEAKQIKEN